MREGMSFQTRFLKKRKFWVCLVCIVALLFLYTQLSPAKIPKRDFSHKVLTEFTWLTLDNSSTLDSCRNSVQGPRLIVDELGYVCPMVWVNPSGCCNIDHSIRFDCSSCIPSMCCAVYEHCVSCCLSSDKKPLLQDILTNSMHPVYSSVKDQFELCLAKCRTSSQSVHHENAYRNPDTKYCYGPPQDKKKP